MAVFKNDQQLYLGRGPLDAKSLVKTYADLFSESTWTKDGTLVAYNGMIVAVWLNKEDTTKNGVYFLLDPLVTTAIKKPDFTKETNWHKIVELSEISVLSTRLADLDSELAELDARLTALEEDSDVITYGYRSGFPTVGEPGRLYVAADEGKSYVWFNDEYLPISSSTSEYEEPEVIYGGSAD